jgi:hypothetical protein
MICFCPICSAALPDEQTPRCRHCGASFGLSSNLKPTNQPASGVSPTREEVATLYALTSDVNSENTENAKDAGSQRSTVASALLVWFGLLVLTVLSAIPFGGGFGVAALFAGVTWGLLICGAVALVRKIILFFSK